MVNRSIKKATNEIVYADKVDRSEASTVGSKGIEWLCFECKQPTIHKHGSVKGPHFAHKAGTPDICPHKSLPHDWYDKSNEDVVSKSTFYRKWVSNQRLFKCDTNNKVYTMGSKKAYVVVLDYIHNKVKDNLDITNDIPQEIYILNGESRNVVFYKTDDSLWVRFGRKCEVGYLLQFKKWIVIDMGHDRLFLIKSDEKLPESEYNLANEINDFYKVQPIDINSFIKDYLPDDYILTDKREFKSITIIQLINNKEEQERRRILREQSELMRIEKERIEKIRNEEFLRMETYAIEQETILKENETLPYNPRKIKNIFEIKMLYMNYLKELETSSESVICFSYNKSEDEIEFIDICKGVIPESQKCAYHRDLLKKIIENKLNEL